MSLNPALQLQYFHDHWAADLEAYIPEVQITCHNYWEKQYLANEPDFTTIPRKRTLPEAFLHKPAVGSQIKDEFDAYISQLATTDASFQVNLFRWNFDNKKPSLHSLRWRWILFLYLLCQ